MQIKSREIGFKVIRQFDKQHISHIETTDTLLRARKRFAEGRYSQAAVAAFTLNRVSAVLAHRFSSVSGNNLSAHIYGNSSLERVRDVRALLLEPFDFFRLNPPNPRRLGHNHSCRGIAISQKGHLADVMALLNSGDFAVINHYRSNPL